MRLITPVAAVGGVDEEKPKFLVGLSPRVESEDPVIKARWDAYIEQTPLPMYHPSMYLTLADCIGGGQILDSNLRISNHKDNLKIIEALNEKFDVTTGTLTAIAEVWLNGMPRGSLTQISSAKNQLTLSLSGGVELILGSKGIQSPYTLFLETLELWEHRINHEDQVRDCLISPTSQIYVSR